MKKKINRARLIAFIIIIIELVGLAVFTIFYFNNISHTKDVCKPEYIIIGAVSVVAINIIMLWISTIRIASYRHKTDLKAAEVIGSDVQEAYNFAMIGLVVTDENDVVIWDNSLFKERHIDIIDSNIFDWQKDLKVLKEKGSSEEVVKTIINNRNFEVKFLSDAGLWIFKDTTDYESIYTYSKQQAPVVGILSMDNYDEVAKKNSFNSLSIRSGSMRRKGVRRTGSILNLDNIKQTLRIQSLQKAEPRDSHFSILKQKNFFKKLSDNNDNDNENELSEKDSSKSFEKEKNEVNEGDKQLESIYFELIKALFEGKIKNFRNIFLKNKNYIDINQALMEGNTLLILAVREGNYQITKFLCEEEADVNIQNADGNTALHYAIGKQFYSLADILTTHGAKEDLQNLKGFSPWDCIEHNVE